MLLPPRLVKGDTIGLAAPCWRVDGQWAAPIRDGLEKMGYRVKYARNLFADGWGYAASPEERASDLNELIHDESVKMIFFGGGEGADDVTDLIDYAAIKGNPKLFLSYSDGTSILNSVWANTGVCVLYGQTPGIIPGISDYNLDQFERFTAGFPDGHIANSKWHCLVPGEARGTLIGGYLANVIYLCAMGRIPSEDDKRYVLFVEDHEKFFGIESESAYIGRLEQCGILKRCAGLLFGHYSAPVNGHLLERLCRLGEKWHIPVAYSDDFGHGENRAILPIGAEATLNTQCCTLTYHW
ncbi:MAG: LD-carboxypeptidase [Clostridia bacterium]|nr:LD-carboxypeptidase [Clostridia bacterium]